MSYILDALRRADAEREHGEVPSLHAQQFALPPDADEPAGRSKAPLWAIAGLSLALIAALGWNFVGHDAVRLGAAQPSPAVSSTPIVAAQTTGAQTTAAQMPMPPPPGVPVATTPLPATAGAAATAAVRGAKTAPSAKAASSTPLAATAAAAKPSRNAARKGVAPMAASASAPASAPASASTATAATAPAPADARAVSTAPEPGRSAEVAADKRVYALRDLPDAVRRELPAVTVGGSTYSTNSASRMLMINGQIFHEGDPIATGLVLQQIKPRAAVFAFKGYRYELAF